MPTCCAAGRRLALTAAQISARLGRLALAGIVVGITLPATAHAQTGGTEFVPEPWLAATTFEVSPASIAPGAELTVRLQLDGRPRRVRVRLALVPEDGGRAAARLRLGRRRTGRPITATWRPQLEPGRYVARLRATTRRRRRATRASGPSALEVVAPSVSAASGIFPVQGSYTLGGAGARFGADRSSHRHQGQDIIAAEGTPVVTPRAGTVHWRAFQAAGAGHYLVIRGDDTRDYVFMHLQDGSLLVDEGETVAAGQRIAAVGATGRSEGAHLHFEIWPNGWWADGSTPIDPLPDLLSWAGPGAAR